MAPTTALACTWASGCCARHPESRGCTPAKSYRATPQLRRSVDGAPPNASALAILGAPLLGLHSQLQPAYEPRSHGMNASAVARHASQRMAFCVVGIAGITSGKASDMSLSPQAVSETAKTQVRHVLQPAEAMGLVADVFAHSWSASAPTVTRAVDAAYGSRLVASIHETLGRYTSERVTSLVLSINGCLQLARAHAMEHAFTYELMVIARHDLFFFRDLPLGIVDPRAFTLAPWCGWSGPVVTREEGALQRQRRCGVLTRPPASGVLDSIFMGGQLLLEHTFGSLQASRLLKLQADMALQSEALTVPPQTLDRSTGRLKNPKDFKAGTGHFVIGNHLRHLGFFDRNLVRMHPEAIEQVVFTRYANRHTRLSLSAAEATLGAERLCDGSRTLCAPPLQGGTRQ